MIVTDKVADIVADDRGETLGLMEPCLIGQTSRHRGELTDLTVELVARSAGFRRSLPSGIAVSLAQLVRSMNCYYSNLIEGHDTHPVDIERALKREYSTDLRRRNLQHEALAHIAEKSFDPHFGARPVKRFLQNQVLNKVASLMISKKFTKGGIAEVKLVKGELVIDAKKAKKIVSPLSKREVMGKK